MGAPGKSRRPRALRRYCDVCLQASTAWSRAAPDGIVSLTILTQTSCDALRAAASSPLPAFSQRSLRSFFAADERVDAALTLCLQLSTTCCTFAFDEGELVVSLLVSLLVVSLLLLLSLLSLSS